MTVGVLLLAAGFSRRFGSDKRLHEVGLSQDRRTVKPLLRHTLEGVIASGLPCRVCLRPGDAEVDELVRSLDAEALVCERAREGMGATLAQGILACEDWDGTLVALGDMAWVDSATYRALAQALQPGTMVRPAMDGRPGNPAGFSRAFYPQLAALEGDRGGRAVLESAPDQVRLVEAEDEGIFRDMDSMGAFQGV